MGEIIVTVITIFLLATLVILWVVSPFLPDGGDDELTEKNNKGEKQ